MIWGLVSTTEFRDASRACGSLCDCDIVMLKPDEGHGQAWVRNELLKLVPAGSVVRYCDDDDVAMNSRYAAERLWESGADALAFSFISGSTRVEVPKDPLAAAIDSVGPWSWVAKADRLREVPWDPSRRSCTGTWQWLAMMDAGFKFAFAPDIWGYHWLPAADGVTANAKPDLELFDELERRIRAAGRLELMASLSRRKARYGLGKGE